MPIKAVIFDWAGTIIDFGSFAPMGVFVKAFEEFGVEISVDEARGPMGLPKRDHIAQLLGDHAIAQRWDRARGSSPTEEDIDAVYKVFVPMNEAVAADYATLVPGARETLAYLDRHGIKVGSTTGYTRSIMERVAPVAAGQGFSPLNMVCADDVVEGRPGPLCMYKSFVDLGVYPPEDVIKVDDTEPGIAEGVAAGCTTVGVTLSGNFAGRTPDEVAIMAETDKQAIRDRAGGHLIAAGADHVIDSIADLPALVDRIEGRS